VSWGCVLYSGCPAVVSATDRTAKTTYDLSGRAKSLEYPSGLTLTYTHDDIGRIVTVNDGANDRVDDTYKGYLLQKREYANGTYLTHLDDSSQNLSGHGYRCLCQVVSGGRGDDLLSLTRRS